MAHTADKLIAQMDESGTGNVRERERNLNFTHWVRHRQYGSYNYGSCPDYVTKRLFHDYEETKCDISNTHHNFPQHKVTVNQQYSTGYVALSENINSFDILS